MVVLTIVTNKTGEEIILQSYEFEVYDMAPNVGLEHTS